MYNLIGFVGFASSGKDTVANFLVEDHGYQPLAFADSIKDCLASIFCWDREMLEGSTPESRKWREKVDVWWANRLGVPQFSPRWAMTHFGTDLMRKYFDEEIWILNTEKRLSQMKDRVIVKDCRFPNEIDVLRKRGGVIYRIKRGPDPAWYSIAESANQGDPVALSVMEGMSIHSSEWAWIGTPIDGLIENNDTISALGKVVRKELVHA